MITRERRSKVDRIRDAFWSAGISNRPEVMEQITYLHFIKRLNDLQTLGDNKATRLGELMARTIFLEGPQPARLTWTKRSHLPPGPRPQENTSPEEEEG